MDCIYGKSVNFGRHPPFAPDASQSAHVDFIAEPQEPPLHSAITTTTVAADHGLDYFDFMAVINGEIDFGGSFESLMDTQSASPMQHQQLVSIQPEPVAERPSTPADEEITRAYDKMSVFCVSHV